MKQIYQRFLTTLFLVVMATGFVFGQGQANIWYFGSGNGLDFNYTPATALENGNNNLSGPDFEGGGAMCTATGALLFYTDGMEVFDKNHNEMPGTVAGNLNGGTGTSTQTGMVVPINGSTTQYFIISTNGSATYYSIVDMTLNAGLGDVVAGSKNTALVASGASEAALAIPEYDASNMPTGESWIIFRSSAGNTYSVYKTSGATIALAGTYSLGTSTSQAALILKTNGCFDKIALSIYNSARVEILPFDNETGIISAPNLTISGSGGAPFLTVEIYGIEFSPNDQFLYVSEGGLNGRRTIYQFDIGGATGTNPAAVIASKKFFTADASVSRFGQVQLGPDGKIYVPAWNPSGTTWMSCIPNPNVAWAAVTPTAAEFEYKKYTYNYVGNRVVGQGLPLFSQALLRQLKILTTNACEAEPTNFSYLFGGGAVSQSWNFGDPGSGALNTSTALSPSHTYNTAGTYTVTLSVTDNCGRVNTTTAVVVIKTGPVVTVPTAACANTNVTLTGTGTNASSYIWSLSPTMSPTVGTGASYVYNGTLPVTVYVQDPTPAATYVTGNTGATQDFASDVGDTRFELLTTVLFESFEVASKTASTGTITLYEWNGSAWVATTGSEAWTSAMYTVTAADVSTSAPKYFYPNVTLNPGRYRLFATNDESFRKNNTSRDGGRDQPGVIDVYGDTDSGNKGGPYYNIEVSIPDPCGVRAYTIPNNCALPVSWLSFTAQAAADYAALTWTVGYEENNEKFIVEVSEDGLHFHDIGLVNSRGNSTTAATYSFNDLNPAAINYYRIKQVDFNGVFSYSAVKTVRFGKEEVTLMPNPFASEVNISFSSTEAASITVVDVMGRILEQHEKPEGSSNYTLGASLPAGTYIVKVLFANKAWAIPVVKK